MRRSNGDGSRSAFLRAARLELEGAQPFDVDVGGALGEARGEVVEAHRAQRALRVEHVDEAALAEAVGGLGDAQRILGLRSSPDSKASICCVRDLVARVGALERGEQLDAPAFGDRGRRLQLRDRLADLALALRSTRESESHAEQDLALVRVLVDAGAHGGLRRAQRAPVSRRAWARRMSARDCASSG